MLGMLYAGDSEALPQLSSGTNTVVVPRAIGKHVRAVLCCKLPKPLASAESEVARMRSAPPHGLGSCSLLLALGRWQTNPSTQLPVIIARVVRRYSADSVDLWVSRTVPGIYTPSL
jgi:hypothetical protein